MTWLDLPAGTGFGIANLPYGVFRHAGEQRPGVRIGDQVLDLHALAADGLLDEGRAFTAPTLKPFMAVGPDAWRTTRARLQELLGDAANRARVEPALVPLGEVELQLPFAVADYVDFYSSLEHATNLGRMFRPDADPLLPNWRSLPVGYHGRAGTVVVSGTPVTRPCGQSKAPAATAPTFGPSRRLDIELELGVVIGTGSELGEPVPVERALDHVFGVVLVNDWSARDIQAWEYQPLGPFLGKSFATSISPWIVPTEALAPYRTVGPAQEPEPLPYLREAPWAFDIALEVVLNGETVSQTSARHLYWSAAQQIAHLTVNGASLRTGDLLASGTISGPEPGQRGSFIEMTWNGAEPLSLPDGTERTFLEDGDEVLLRGVAGDGSPDPVALGEVTGRIEPAGCE